MTRKNFIKRIVSGFVSAAIAMTSLPIIPIFAETGTNSYSFDGYNVEYSVKNEWSDGQAIEVKITNTGDEPILNWAFKYNAQGEISDLWNASVYDAKETSYIIKNAGWNYEIAPDASVSFGYTLSDYSGTNPEQFELCAKRVDKTDGYDVQYNITNEWDTGLQGEIIITNTSEEPLEAWELSFDSTFAINNLWDGRIISSEENHYVVASEMWSNPIAVGVSVTIGFTGDKVEETELTINNTKVSVVEISRLEEIQLDIDWTDETDTDGDGLPDIYEIYIFETDPNDVDTDKDGLTDFEEVCIVLSDPKKYNSIDENVSDSEADPDGDTLSNRIEIDLGTNPLFGDSDNDSISDGDEVQIYGTDPLKADTDDDNLNDNDEIELSTDPLNPDTNGNGVLDGDETYTVLLAESNVDPALCVDNAAIPHLSVSGKGNPNSYVEVSEYRGKEQVNELCIGKTIVISGDNIESGKLTFDVSDDSAFESHEYIDGYSGTTAVICYNNGTNTIPLVTTVDNNTGTISADINNKGTYFVVNVPKLVSEWSFDKYMLESGEYELGGQADIVFIIDVTGSMGGTINNVINNVTAFAEKVESSGVKPRYALVEYGDIESDGDDSTKVKTNSGSNWYTDADDFKKALQNLGSTWGGDSPECAIDALAMAYNLDMRNTAEKCFVLITDAEYKIANNFGYTSDTQLFNDLAEKDISVAVATATGYYSTYNKLINTTNGFCCNIYGDFNKELLKISDFISEKTNEGYWIALNGFLPYVVKLEAEPVAGSNTDTDKDGEADVNEITDTTVFNVKEYVSIAFASSGTVDVSTEAIYPDVEVYNYSSNPADKDSDGDGLLDGKAQINEETEKFIAPKDEEPLIYNGPTNLWKTHIDYVTGNNIPHTIKNWYGRIDNQEVTNTGIEGLQALSDEVQSYIDNMGGTWANLDVLWELEGLKYNVAAGNFDIAYLVYSSMLEKISNRFGYVDEKWIRGLAASLGSRALNFKMDEGGKALHSQHNSWQALGGYNNIYDFFFYFFTQNMDNIKLPFKIQMPIKDVLKCYGISFDEAVEDYNNLVDEVTSIHPLLFMMNNAKMKESDGDLICNWIIWGWRGDYLNLGPGAEVGIYFRPDSIFEDLNKNTIDHYCSLPGFSVNMQLYLYNYNNDGTIENLISWEPDEPQWWITGFNVNKFVDENYQVDYTQQVMVCMLDFSDFDGDDDSNCMLDAIIKAKNGEDWEKANYKYVVVDKENSKIWICWYSEVLNENN